MDNKELLESLRDFSQYGPVDNNYPNGIPKQQKLAEVLHGVRFELAMPDDVKRNGQLKYYRSQHVLAIHRSRQVRHEAKQRSLRMLDKLSDQVDRGTQARDSVRSARRERRQARKASCASRVR